MRAQDWDVLRSVAGHGLRGSKLELPARLDDHAWRRVRAGAAEQRISGSLLSVLRDGFLGADPQRVAEVAGDELASMALALKLERHLLEVADLLSHAGVEWRLLKGPAIAHLDYPNPAKRGFGDIDVLVREDQYDEACAVLSHVGGTRRFAEPKRHFDQRFGKGVCFVMPSGFELDLHRSFVAGPFGLLLRQEDLFEVDSDLVLAGRHIKTLAREERFLHACYHAVLGARPPRLVPLRDVAQLVLNGLDMPRVEALTSRWKVDALVAVAVETVWNTFALADSVPLSEWARSYQPTRQESRRLGAYTSARRSYAAEAAAALSAIPRVGDKLAYLRAMAFPDRAYMQARDGTYRHRLGRGVRVATAARTQADE